MKSNDNNFTSVCIIPARGGSKRIPGKNIKEFNGKPMIAWPIDTVLKSDLFDRVIVSTDSTVIAETAKSFGAETPFIRPQNLSDDYTGTTEVIAHSISWMNDNGYHPNLVCCVYPTSIFLHIGDLIKGYQKIINENWSYTFSVTDFDYPIFRSFKIIENHGLSDPFSLLKKVDVLITDYSGIYVDYLLMNRPIIFANFDHQGYVNASSPNAPPPMERDWQRFQVLWQAVFRPYLPDQPDTGYHQYRQEKPQTPTHLDVEEVPGLHAPPRK